MDAPYARGARTESSYTLTLKGKYNKVVSTLIIIIINNYYSNNNNMKGKEEEEKEESVVGEAGGSRPSTGQNASVQHLTN